MRQLPAPPIPQSSTPSTATETSSMTFPSPVPSAPGPIGTSVTRHSEPTSSTSSTPGFATSTTPAMANHSTDSGTPSSTSFPSVSAPPSAGEDLPLGKPQQASLNQSNLRHVLQMNNTNSDRSGPPKSTTIPPWLGASPLGMVPVNKQLQDSIVSYIPGFGARSSPGVFRYNWKRPSIRFPPS